MRGLRVPTRMAFFSGFGESDVHPLEAFDLALNSAGVHEFNLVYYSSVIPAGVNFEHVAVLKELPRGTELPVVLAAMDGYAGEFLVACIGYAYNDEFGGIVVEVHGKGKNEQEVLVAGKKMPAEEVGRFSEMLAQRLLENRGIKPNVSGSICSHGLVKRRYGYAVAGVAFVGFRQIRCFFSRP